MFIDHENDPREDGPALGDERATLVTDRFVAEAPDLDVTADDPWRGPVSLREVGVDTNRIYLELVRRGMFGLVQPQLSTAGQADGRHDAPALVPGFARGADALSSQLGQRGRQVIAHQIELRRLRTVRGMDGNLGWG